MTDKNASKDPADQYRSDRAVTTEAKPEPATAVVDDYNAPAQAARPVTVAPGVPETPEQTDVEVSAPADQEVNVEVSPTDTPSGESSSDES